jgi:hypothetical protein
MPSALAVFRLITSRFLAPTNVRKGSKAVEPRQGLINGMNNRDQCPWLAADPRMDTPRQAHSTSRHLAHADYVT